MSEMTDYGMQHRPPDADTGAPLYDLTGNGVYPADFYERPDWYPAGHDSDGEALVKIFRARGKPKSTVWIYRAVPRGVRTISPGDWVAITKGYARDHGRHPTDPNQDMEVITAKVHASDIHTAGDSFQEWGYNGPSAVKGTVSFRPRKKSAASEMRESPLETLIETIFAATNEWDYEYFGLRISDERPEEGAQLDVSWNEETEEYLEGTSTIKVDHDRGVLGVRRALALARGYRGQWLSLVGADHSPGFGEDAGELLLTSPVVLMTVPRTIDHDLMREGEMREQDVFEPVEWDEDYGGIPAYARDFERARVPVSQIASPFINPISQERIDELAQLENSGHTLPPIIVDGPHEVEEVDYPEEKYPFLDGHYPEIGEEFWYVHDGHHRVALAIERGDRYIDALVMG